MPAKVILNPNCDLGSGIAYLEEIVEAARPFGGIDVALSSYPGHAVELAREAAGDGYDLVVAAGGDGTVHEVVNGLMTAKVEEARLGVLPLGTGNDFAYVLGVPDDVPTAVANLFQGRTRTIDLALLEDDKGGRRYIANNMGVGLDANVVIRTESITQVHGFLKYFIGVLTTLARDFTPLPLHARFDGEEVQQEALFLYLALGTRGGGGFLLTPDGSHEDGLLDSLLVPALGRLRVISLLYAATQGTHVNTPYVSMRKNKEVAIHSPEAMPIQTDGEVYATPNDDIHQLLVTSLPQALKVVV